MRKIPFLALLCAASVGLSACDSSDQADTYSYLLMHPHILKREMNACQKQVQIGEEPTTHCGLVDKAASQMMELIEEQQKNPEKFGQDVLLLQLQASTIEQDVNAAREQVNKLRAQHASSKLIDDAESAYAESLKLQNTINDNVRIALAVIGLSSPE